MDWQPEVNKETGIRRLWEWVSSNEDLLRALGADQVDDVTQGRDGDLAREAVG